MATPQPSLDEGDSPVAVPATGQVDPFEYLRDFIAGKKEDDTAAPINNSDVDDSSLFNIDPQLLGDQAPVDPRSNDAASPFSNGAVDALLSSGAGPFEDELTSVHPEPYDTPINHDDMDITHYDTPVTRYDTPINHYDAPINHYDTTTSHFATPPPPYPLRHQLLGHRRSVSQPPEEAPHSAPIIFHRSGQYLGLSTTQNYSPPLPSQTPQPQPQLLRTVHKRAFASQARHHPYGSSATASGQRYGRGESAGQRQRQHLARARSQLGRMPRSVPSPDWSEYEGQAGEGAWGAGNGGGLDDGAAAVIGFLDRLVRECRDLMDVLRGGWIR